MTPRLLWSLPLLALTAGAAEARDYIVSVGGRARTAPPYEGSDVYITRPAPTFSIRPADRPYRFTPPDNGTTFSIIDSELVEFGPMARFRYRRKATGDLTGLRELKWAAEPGVFLDLWPTRWLRLRGEARHGVGGHKGYVGDAGFDLVYTGTKWSVSLGGRTGWGSREYIDDYFGVTPLEALRSPRITRAYAPNGGRRYAGVEVAGAYELMPRLQLKADLGYRRLAEKAADSPIVAVAGSRDQYSGSIGVSYAFRVGL